MNQVCLAPELFFSTRLPRMAAANHSIPFCPGCYEDLSDLHSKTGRVSLLTLSVVSGGLNFSDWAHQWVSTYCFRMTDASCEGTSQVGEQKKVFHTHTYTQGLTHPSELSKSGANSKLFISWPCPFASHKNQVERTYL